MPSSKKVNTTGPAKSTQSQASIDGGDGEQQRATGAEIPKKKQEDGRILNAERPSFEDPKHREETQQEAKRQKSDVSSAKKNKNATTGEARRKDKDGDEVQSFVAPPRARRKGVAKKDQPAASPERNENDQDSPSKMTKSSSRKRGVEDEDIAIENQTTKKMKTVHTSRDHAMAQNVASEMSWLKEYVGNLETEEQYRTFTDYFFQFEHTEWDEFQRQAVMNHITSLPDHNLRSSFIQRGYLYAMLERTPTWLLGPCELDGHLFDGLFQFFMTWDNLMFKGMLEELELIREDKQLQKLVRSNKTGPQALKRYLEKYREQHMIEVWDGPCALQLSGRTRKEYLRIRTQQQIDHEAETEKLKSSPDSGSKTSIITDSDVINEIEKANDDEFGKASDDEFVPDDQDDVVSTETITDEQLIQAQGEVTMRQTLLERAEQKAVKAARQYKHLDAKYLQAFTAMLSDSNTAHGDELTLESVEAKMEACKSFQQERNAKMKELFLDPLLQVEEAKKELENAQYAYKVLFMKFVAQAEPDDDGNDSFDF